MAVITTSNPPTVRAPSGYSHGIIVQGAERRLVISGQVGMAPDGSVSTTGEGQIAQAFANLRAVLEANGMSPNNVVKIHGVPDRPRVAAGLSFRPRAFFAGQAPASTLLFISGLADPRFMVEIEAEAVA